MTLKASLYDQLTREELIRLLEARDNEPDNAEIYISFGNADNQTY